MYCMALRLDAIDDVHSNMSWHISASSHSQSVRAHDLVFVLNKNNLVDIKHPVECKLKCLAAAPILRGCMTAKRFSAVVMAKVGSRAAKRLAASDTRTL